MLGSPNEKGRGLAASAFETFRKRVKDENVRLGFASRRHAGRGSTHSTRHSASYLRCEHDDIEEQENAFDPFSRAEPGNKPIPPAKRANFSLLDR